MKRILKNIKTSFFGSVAGLPLIGDGLAEKDWIKVVSGLGIMITGLLAKDSDVQ